MKLLAFFLLLLSGRLVAQPTVYLLQMAQMPLIANESSGLVKAGPNSFWTHNDSFGPAELYEADSSGILIRTLQLTNCSNFDWEELSADAAGNFYIGDFGNNLNIRSILSIYRIPPPSSITGNTFAVQDTIRFYYPDQTSFPPPQNAWNYDMEAMTVFQDSIYLFTKNRTSPYTGYTRLYVIPAQPGLHAAGLRDSIFTGIGTVDDYSITGAAITSDGSRLLLMSNLRFWVITNYALPHLSQGQKTEYIFNTATQKEAVALDGDTMAWFTDEGPTGSSGHLYRLNDDSLLTALKVVSPLQPEVWPNTFDSELNVRTQEPAEKIVLTDFTGKILISRKTPKLQEAIPTEKLKSGVYMLRVDYKKGSRYVKVVKE